MTIKSSIRLSDRTWMLTFDDDISVMVIIGTNFTVLCDTHLGPDSIKEIHQFLEPVSHSAKFFIFNSHSDWDHIWGNCAFPGMLIAGHISSRVRMKERGTFDLSRHNTKTRGLVQIRLPNLTFDSGLILDEDDVEFSYAPGHTIDSSVCLDRKDNILYLGDLAEDPIPYIDYERVDIYIRTLESILKFPANILVSAHSGIITRDLIRSNIDYLDKVSKGHPIDTSSFGPYEKVHQANLNTLIICRYERLVKEKYGDTYSFDRFWSSIPDPEETDTETMEESLKSLLHEGLKGRDFTLQ